jgi:hypothetical protein
VALASAGAVANPGREVMVAGQLTLNETGVWVLVQGLHVPDGHSPGRS